MEKNSDIDDKQLAVIKKRLDSGRTLTAAQIRFVREYRAKEAVTDADIASGVTDLARRLNVNTQVINWHRGRDEAPKSFSVSAWREYLLTHGKGSTIDRLSPPCSQESSKEAMESATLFQFNAVSNELPHAVSTGLKSEGVTVSAEQLDRLTVAVWLLLAAKQQATADMQGIDGIFDADKSEAADYPPAIVAICKRIEKP